jgi:hypothetical protein
MHAYLIIGRNEDTKIIKAKEIASVSQAKLVDFPAKKIEDIRHLNKFLNLSPQIKTAVLLENIDTATPEAMNALLKNLEEKASFIFILTASSKQKVLPTIISRCELITVKESVDKINQELALEFIKMTTPQKLDYTNSLKTRSEALEFLDKLILVCEKQLEDNQKALTFANIIQKALLAKKYLSANTNVFLQLTNFVISLDESVH